MHKLGSRGLRLAGLMAMALAVAHCGDSSVNVVGGNNIDPAAGTFRGTTGNDGIVTLGIGSVESAILECDGQTFGGACNPVIPVSNSTAIGTCNGVSVDITFTSNDQARLNDISGGTSCDGSGSASRTDTTPPTVTPVNGVTPTPTQTPGGGGPTMTGNGPDTPTITPTPDDGGDPPCPEAARVEGFGGNLQVLDSGWTGFGHNARVISDGVLTVNMNCGTTERPCGVCTVSGPIDNPGAGAGTIDNRRCRITGAGTNSSTRCTSSGDCGGQACSYYFGAPLPLVAGGVQTCVFNEVSGNASGTANVETGAFQSDIGLTSHVFTGFTAENPCPTCEGDTALNDSSMDGTCNGGARAGQPCDGNGVSLEFGTTSLDCPLTGVGIGSLPINLSGSSGTESLVIAANSPNCRALGFTNAKCACDTCANSNPCQTDDDCGGTPGSCGTLRCLGGSNSGGACTTAGIGDPVCNGAPCSGSGEATRPNGCSNTVCTPKGGSTREGECSGGPFDSTCNPVETFRSCSSGADCPFPGDSCVAGPRPCFLDNGTIGEAIVAQGDAGVPVNGVSDGLFATTFCIAPVSSPAINAAAGLPGAGRVELPIEGREIVGGVVAGGE